MALQFKKAVKYGAKGRVALVGPAGSGKSYTALRAARTLVGPSGKIAALDTEHGSLSKYAHTPKCGGEGVCEDRSHFEFDVLELDSYSPENFEAGLKLAIKEGYGAFVADSLSHFWMGKDGALEFVDMAAKKSSSRDGMSGWKEFRPHERSMVDAMIAAPLHVIVTMRTKTDYQEVKDERSGKVKRVKVGLAPVQREGLEYEFDLVGLMDEDNNFIVDKSRCFAMNGKVYTKPGEKEFVVFREWLSGEDAPPKPAQSQPPQQHTQHGSGHKSQLQQLNMTPFRVKNNQVTCHVTAVDQRETTNKGKKVLYRLVKMNGSIEGQSAAFCFHASLFDAVDLSVDKSLQFEFEVRDSANGKRLSVVDVLAVDGKDYRDGKPYIEPKPSSELFENPDPEPVLAGAVASTEITDDDIPF